ncbi:hypothetical protein CIB48_g10435 [Xylaria polymorpha]|nr:hypothetical protein CIB48_g10435 [Xylaria polymorpha]
MSYDPISYLGLSCPSGGDFYICQGSKIKFLGCCEIDPCGDGCPLSALYSASFDARRYNEILAQGCVTGSSSSALWYTCASGPTFLGCCTSNPCQNESVCPDENLAGARLADDPSSASAFLTATTATTVTSTTSTTSTSTDEGTSTPAFTTTTQIPSPTFITDSEEEESPPQHNHMRTYCSLPGVHITTHFAAAPRSCQLLYPPLSMTSTRHKSLSASLSSIIGFKRGSTARRQSFQISEWAPGTHDSTQASPSFPGPVAELESLPPGGIIVRGPFYNTVHYEVEGSTPTAAYDSLGKGRNATALSL